MCDLKRNTIGTFFGNAKEWAEEANKRGIDCKIVTNSSGNLISNLIPKSKANFSKEITLEKTIGLKVIDINKTIQVISVENNGKANKLGILKDDIILEVDNKKIENINSFLQTITANIDYKDFSLRVVRNNERLLLPYSNISKNINKLTDTKEEKKVVSTTNKKLTQTKIVKKEKELNFQDTSIQLQKSKPTKNTNKKLGIIELTKIQTKIINTDPSTVLKAVNELFLNICSSYIVREDEKSSNFWDRNLISEQKKINGQLIHIINVKYTPRPKTINCSLYNTDPNKRSESLKLMIKSPEITSATDNGFQFYANINSNDKNNKSNTANLNSTVKELKEYHNVIPTTVRIIYSYYDRKKNKNVLGDDSKTYDKYFGALKAQFLLNKVEVKFDDL